MSSAGPLAQRRRRIRLPTVDSRAATIEQAQAQKAIALHPFQPNNRVEAFLDDVENTLLNGGVSLHPFFDSAYSGGGFTLGAGYGHHVSAYNMLDVRGSFTFKGYTRVEAAFMAPRFLSRRASLTLLGGWRNATQVGFYGVGQREHVAIHNRADYSFEQPYGSGTLDVSADAQAARARRARLDVGDRDVGSGKGAIGSSVDEIYIRRRPCRASVPHRPMSTRRERSASTSVHRLVMRGAAVTYALGPLQDYHDSDGLYGFRLTDYDAVQHLPLLRDAWVLSLHGRAEPGQRGRHDQIVPYFHVLPSLGGGLCLLRGFTSWRFLRSEQACCCRPSGGSSPTVSSTWRSSTTRAGWHAAHRRSDLTSAPR